MTPAINLIQKSGQNFRIHEYKHDPSSGAYGLEAVEALNLDAARVFKTLLVMLDGNPKTLAVGIIPALEKLDLKAIAKAMGAKKAEMADPGKRKESPVIWSVASVLWDKNAPCPLHWMIRPCSLRVFSSAAGVAVWRSNLILLSCRSYAGLILSPFAVSFLCVLLSV